MLTRPVVINEPSETVNVKANGTGVADAFMTVHWEAQKRFGRWEEILKEPAPPTELPVSTAYFHFIRGIALTGLKG